MRGSPRVHHTAPCRSLFARAASGHPHPPSLPLHRPPLTRVQAAAPGTPFHRGRSGRACLLPPRQAATVSGVRLFCTRHADTAREARPLLPRNAASVRGAGPLHWGAKRDSLPPSLLLPPHLQQGHCAPPLRWPSCLNLTPHSHVSALGRGQHHCHWPAQRVTPLPEGPLFKGTKGPQSERASSGAQCRASGSSSRGGRQSSQKGNSQSCSLSNSQSGSMEFKDGIRFIEIAANLTDGMFRGVYHGKAAHPPDIQSVLQRAWDAGVEKVIVTGGNLEGSREALALARMDERLFSTVGVHPTRCSEFEASGDPEAHLGELLALAREGAAEGKVVAVGECGLDYDRLQFCPADVQRKYFAMQFRLAEATGLPMFLHMRAAADDFLSIVKAHTESFVSGVVHSFTGSAPERDAILADPKLFIGINGCSLKTEDNLEVVRGVPVERMMLETDCPYCDVRSSHAGAKFLVSKWPSKKKEAFDPSAMVKGRNEPCQIRQVLEVVCGARGEAGAAQLAETVYATTNKMFFARDS